MEGRIVEIKEKRKNPYFFIEIKIGFFGKWARFYDEQFLEDQQSILHGLFDKEESIKQKTFIFDHKINVSSFIEIYKNYQELQYTEYARYENIGRII